jgi:hypothetical protein
MVYRGHVLGDVIVLADGVRLPDGSEVLVEPIFKTAPAPQSLLPTRNGVPVFPRGTVELRPDLDLVNELRDDSP